MEDYSSIRENEIMSFAGNWSEITMLSETSQTHKDRYCTFSLVCEIEIHKCKQTKSHDSK
jgi:hypothetical protein